MALNLFHLLMEELELDTAEEEVKDLETRHQDKYMAMKGFPIYMVALVVE